MKNCCGDAVVVEKDESVRKQVKLAESLLVLRLPMYSMMIVLVFRVLLV